MSGPDTIEFDASLAGKTLLLTQGEFLIKDDLTVRGLGADQLTIDASGSDPTPDENNGDGSRVFHMPLDVDGTENSLTVSGLTLTGGDSIFKPSIFFIGQEPGPDSGGAIRAIGSFSIIDSAIIDNHAHRSGGGVYASTQAGTIEISNTIFQGNQVSRAGGLLLVGSPPQAQGGGAFVSADQGQVSIASSTFENNHAVEGGGLYLNSLGANATAEVTHTRIANNTAGAAVSSSFSFSTPNFGGGGTTFMLQENSALQVDSSVIANNTVGPTGDELAGISRTLVGGGIHLQALASNHVQVTNTLISENRSHDHGAGLYAELGQQIELNVSESTFVSNIAELGPGGGAYVEFAESGSEVNLQDATFQKNQAHTGGAISYWAENEIADSQLNLSGVSITDNRAVSSGGGGRLLIRPFRTIRQVPLEVEFTRRADAPIFIGAPSRRIFQAPTKELASLQVRIPIRPSCLTAVVMPKRFLAVQ